MGKKEKLANQYLELKKEFDGSDFMENITEHQIWWLVREFKANQLETKINAVRRAIDEKNLRLKREAFYETEAGKKYKNDLEYRKEHLINIRKMTISSVNGFVQKYLNENIGDGWTCQFNHSYNICRMTIGLKAVDPERIEHNFTFEFGHEFEISWDNDFYGNGKKFEMNYGTLGAFDLENNNLRPKYLLGMAMFCNDKNFLSELDKKFTEANEKLMEIRNEIDNVNKKLEKPEI